jgi:hypothetical protein
VDQFFEFQNTPANQKVSLASFHLEGEANQWRQWARRTYKEEGRIMTWEAFEDELWARFGPIDCEDFDEALSRIKQVGSLRDYQSEFEKLGNRVRGWTQKALVGTFMGGLKPEIAEGIRMFKPQSLKEAISLAHMKDEQMKNIVSSYGQLKSIEHHWRYQQQHVQHQMHPFVDYHRKRCRNVEPKDSALIVMRGSPSAINVMECSSCFWKVQPVSMKLHMKKLLKKLT